MRDVAMWIDHVDAPAAGGHHMMVENPATEETIGRVARAQRADVDAAVNAARRAQPGWRRTPALSRAQLLHEIAAMDDGQ